VTHWLESIDDDMPELAMRAFKSGKVVVEFADFKGTMVRHERFMMPAGGRQDRYWVRTAQGDLPLDLFDKDLQVKRGHEISVLYGSVPGGELRSAICVFNHCEGRLTPLSEGKVLHQEFFPRSRIILPFIACLATSAVAGAYFDWWGASAGFVVYYLLKAESAKRKMLLVSGLDLHLEKLSKRYVREVTRRRITRLLARHL
jgi:hypothetical protein